MKYKYELHCHTAGVSLCASAEPKEIINRYYNLGYSGIVLTDHYSPLTFYKHYLTPQRDIDRYLSSYKMLKEYCGNSFTVLLGMELRHYATVNDYLIYGVEEGWLRSQKNLMMLDEKKAYKKMHTQGYLVYQAHPYRPFITRCNPEYIDGIEIYNGHTSDGLNSKAVNWANTIGKKVISGSDFHNMSDAVRGGIETDIKIDCNSDLLGVLKSGNYKVLGSSANH